MISQPGKHTIAIHLWPNISQIRRNHTMKFRQLIENNKRYTVLQKPCKNEAERIVPDLLLF